MKRKHWLWTAAVGTALLSSCSTGLKEYQQVTLEVNVPSAELAADEGGETPDELDYLAETEAVLARRLRGFGVETAEIESEREPERIVVRLPLAVDVTAAEDILTRKGQLYLRNEKPDTEAALSADIEDLQRLLVEQNTLVQTEQPAAAEALQPQIDEARGAIADFFEPSELTGERLQSAKAVREESDVWAVLIQFDEEGAKMFAEQTKEMAGTGRVMGLFLDDVLLSTPVVDVSFVETGITGGEALIAGNFTEQGAKDLEIKLNSGALPVGLKTIEVTSTESEKVAPSKKTEGDKKENTEQKKPATQQRINRRLLRSPLVG